MLLCMWLWWPWSRVTLDHCDLGAWWPWTTLPLDHCDLGAEWPWSTVTFDHADLGPRWPLCYLYSVTWLYGIMFIPVDYAVLISTGDMWLWSTMTLDHFLTLEHSDLGPRWPLCYLCSWMWLVNHTSEDEEAHPTELRHFPAQLCTAVGPGTVGTEDSQIPWW